MHGGRRLPKLDSGRADDPTSYRFISSRTTRSARALIGRAWTPWINAFDQGACDGFAKKAVKGAHGDPRNHNEAMRLDATEW
eukprot:3142179-Prymnesium_polylepis.1